jgi:asparaginyl-tRNA synthetase
MPRTPIKILLNTAPVDSEATVAGWLRTRRDSKGGFSFLELNDGSCFANLQIVAPGELPNYSDEVQKLHPGAAIRVTGKVVASPGAGQAVEIQATNVQVLGFCNPEEYPLGKQRISFERLRELAHMRARTNTFGAVTRVRNVLSRATHDFFQKRGFYYLNTPIVTGSDCEGAGQMFRVTTLPPTNPPLNDQGEVDFHRDFFSRETCLTVSGQLEAETYACALGAVYTFGPTFRAENSNTPRHLAEFWMVEPEVAFADLNDDADLAEAYVQFCFRAVLEECQDDLAFFDKRIERGLLARLEKLAGQSFERMTYTEAVERLQKTGKTFEFPVDWGIDLQTEHERCLTEEICGGPVTVTDYPKDIKAFYMRMNDDDKTVAAMDVLLPQVGEMIGGSQREERLDRLEARMREMHLPADDYWWYLDLRRFGSVPHAGFGLGFERLVQFCTGMKNIRDVIPFPRTPRNADF